MGDDLETLSKEQLTRLAQYFDERVISGGDYKTRRGEVPHVPQ
jgi:hypothetical protein